MLAKIDQNFFFFSVILVHLVAAAKNRQVFEMEQLKAAAASRLQVNGDFRERSVSRSPFNHGP